MYDERLDQLQDYSRKRGVVQSRIITLDNAPDWTRNRAELWNKAEAAERQYNGQPAREIRLALPDELTDGQRADLVFDYVNDTFVSRGMIADVSIHRPDRHGDERNHHAHILLTMRELDGDKFARTKQREWNKSELVEDWREQWAEYQNRALEEAGFDARVDHRTLEAQGIDRDPTRHMGKEASAMERDGVQTRIGDENRAALLQDAELDRLRGELVQVDAEVKRQLLTPRQPEEPGKKGLRYMEWYAMQPEPATEDKAFFFPAQEEPILTWDEQKEAAQDPFKSEVTARFNRDITEYGEIREYGLGKRWYDRTMVMFENLYYGTIEKVTDFWQKYAGKREPARDRDEPDKGDMERW